MGKFELKGWMKGAIIGGLSSIAIRLLQTEFSVGLPYTIGFSTNPIADIIWLFVVGGIVGSMIGWILERFD